MRQRVSLIFQTSVSHFFPSLNNIICMQNRDKTIIVKNSKELSRDCHRFFRYMHDYFFSNACGFKFKWKKLDSANFSSRKTIAAISSEQAEMRSTSILVFPEVQWYDSDVDQAQSGPNGGYCFYWLLFPYRTKSRVRQRKVR